MPSARRLSDDLRDVLRSAAGRDVTLEELEHKLQGRGFALFILLLSIPFCFPIPLPGLSIGFGIVIMLLGIRITLGRKPKLPDFVLHKEIKYKTLERIVKLGLKLCERMEKIARPRMRFLRDHPNAVKLIGIGLASGGIQLLLPIPPIVPLSNTIPAISVVLLTVGLIERDGAFVLCGYFVNLCAWAYFAFMFMMGKRGIEMILHYFK